MPARRGRDRPGVRDPGARDVGRQACHPRRLAGSEVEEAGIDALDPLELLQSAQGDPALLALATIDLAYAGLDQEQRARLRAALEAAAVPHWCNGEILAALLGIPPAEAAPLWQRLYELTVVEPFPARGEGAGNVHEATRLALRRRLATTDPDRLRRLSGECAAYFESDASASGRIEWLYHTLVADPDHGAAALEQASCDWIWVADHRDQFALITALTELIDTGSLEAGAELWARFLVAYQRSDTEGAAQVAEVSGEILGSAAASGDRTLEAEAEILEGDVAVATGDLAAARQRFERARDLLQELTAKSPDDSCRLRELAVAHSRVGDVAQAQGDLELAQQALGECLEILRRLAEADPDQLDWRRNYLIALSRWGDISMLRGGYDAAGEALEEVRTRFEELVAADPGNTSWQRDLASAWLSIGDLANRRADAESAAAAYARHVEVIESLVAQDPANTDWQLGLAVAHHRVGEQARNRGDLDAAQAGFDRHLAIVERLATEDPRNTTWRREVASGHTWRAHIATGRGDFETARLAIATARAVQERLVATDPTNADWQRVLADIEWEAERLAAAERGAS